MKVKPPQELQPPQEVAFSIQRIDVRLRDYDGALLVVRNFSEKAKTEIRDKQAKKARQAKSQRKPEEECDAARYLDAEGRECVPLMAIKKSIVNAATAFEDLTKVALRQALFVAPLDGGMLVPIETYDGKPHRGTMREDAVTLSGGVRGLAYRPQYEHWQLIVRIEYNPHLVSKEQLMALIAHAGWGVGIGEGRPEKSSALGWGRFRVETL